MAAVDTPKRNVRPPFVEVGGDFFVVFSEIFAVFASWCEEHDSLLNSSSMHERKRHPWHRIARATPNLLSYEIVARSDFVVKILISQPRR